MYEAEVLADSVAPNGRRMTSMLVTLPQLVEQELLRHRSFSFSFGSTRAIPMATQVKRVQEDPVVPASWGRAGRGMQAREELSEEEATLARTDWLRVRDDALRGVRRLIGERPTEYLDSSDRLCIKTLKVHKQVAGRLLQPWAWRTGVMTATNWRQFFLLRCHPDAQPEIAAFAYRCLCAYLSSVPANLSQGQWHAPYVTLGEWAAHPADPTPLIQASVGRCAWVSFRPFSAAGEDPKRDFDAAVAKHNELAAGSGGIGHWSPMEHQGQALGVDDRHARSGNLVGFAQYRQSFASQDVEDSIDDKFLLSAYRDRPDWVRAMEAK